MGDEFGIRGDLDEKLGSRTPAQPDECGDRFGNVLKGLVKRSQAGIDRAIGATEQVGQPCLQHTPGALASRVEVPCLPACLASVLEVGSRAGATDRFADGVLPNQHRANGAIRAGRGSGPDLVIAGLAGRARGPDRADLAMLVAEPAEPLRPGSAAVAHRIRRVAIAPARADPAADRALGLHAGVAATAQIRHVRGCAMVDPGGPAAAATATLRMSIARAADRALLGDRVRRSGRTTTRAFVEWLRPAVLAQSTSISQPTRDPAQPPAGNARLMRCRVGLRATAADAAVGPASADRADTAAPRTRPGAPVSPARPAEPTTRGVRVRKIVLLSSALRARRENDPLMPRSFSACASRTSAIGTCGEEAISAEGCSARCWSTARNDSSFEQPALASASSAISAVTSAKLAMIRLATRPTSASRSIRAAVMSGQAGGPWSA